MDSLDPKLRTAPDFSAVRSEIVRVLGLYRAEYSESSINQFFKEPLFWQPLSDRRPAFLIGGRGTGKTVALRMLAYDGQRSLYGSDVSRWRTLAVYWRLSVLALSAFKGARLSEDDWTRVFGHWVNLQLVVRVLNFLEWRRETLGENTVVDGSKVRRTALALGLERTDDVERLHEDVRDELARFQAAINGLTNSVPSGTLSMLGDPLALLLEALSDDPVFKDRMLTICLDEFENLEDYQQRVINTLLKHVGDAKYTFKIGVKPTGIRDRRTLNLHEVIGEVADYTSLNIAEFNKAGDFGAFAARVCQERFLLMDERFRPQERPEQLFPGLSEDEEARRLGADAAVQRTREDLRTQGANEEDLKQFDEMSRASSYLVSYWARSNGVTELEVLKDAAQHPKSWSNRANNYAYAALFTIRKPTGPHLRKYYAGWATLCLLADGNIRYLLDLVSTSLLRHVDKGFDLSILVDADTQTRAAADVGRKLVLDLEGRDDLGRQMMLLVHGLGRIFQVLAREPWGHTPEVNQFRINWDSAVLPDESTQRLLDTCVMHSGLVRFEGDKRAAASGETREYDYQLHPIFSPYFEYSHRRKRRLTLSSSRIVELSRPKTSERAIETVLRAQKRSLTQVDENPLFEWLVSV